MVKVWLVEFTILISFPLKVVTFDISSVASASPVKTRTAFRSIRERVSSWENSTALWAVKGLIMLLFVSTVERETKGSFWVPKGGV